MEDQRRRDPVKRVIAAGIVAVVLMAGASSWLQLKSTIAKSEMNKAEGLVAARKTEYQQVLDNKKRLQDATHKLGSLNQLATNRLLYGTLLNALQQTTIDDVHLVRLRCDQSFVYNDEVKAKTNSDEHVTPGRPASVTEKVLVTLEARDSGTTPGDNVNKLKKQVADNSYFQGNLGKTNEVRLVSLSPPNSLDGKPFVQFTLECKYPEKTR